MTRYAPRFVLVLALAAFSACASNTVNIDVTRFHELPPLDAQTVAIVPKDSGKSGSMEFAAYAERVAQALAAQGFQPAGEAAPDFIAQIDYFQRPLAGETDDSGSRVGIGIGGGSGGRSHVGVGLGTSFNLGGKPKQLAARTFIIEIDDRESGSRLFEGRAESKGPADNFGGALPYMIDALFDGFPGNSGETLTVKRSVE